MVNGIAGILKIFYPVIPSVSKEDMDKAERAVGKLTQKSSVEEFDCLQSAVDDANKHTEEGCDDKKTVMGKAFRDFSRFLAQQGNDPDRTLCDLRRVLTPSSDVCWTTDEQVERIQAKAEAETEVEAKTETDETLPQPTVPSEQVTQAHRPPASSSNTHNTPTRLYSEQNLGIDQLHEPTDRFTGSPNDNMNRANRANSMNRDERETQPTGSAEQATTDGCCNCTVYSRCCWGFSPAVTAATIYPYNW